jgi:hypothetical protein
MIIYHSQQWKVTGILPQWKILIFCCTVLKCLDRGTSDVQHNTGTIFNTARNYPDSFLFPVYNQENEGM